jgi:formylglycine-generating enzyme required for sulfatase activity
MSAAIPGIQPDKVDPKELEASVAELNKEIEQTTADIAPAKKVLDEMAVEQKKLEDELGKAEREAREAEKVASDKKKAAEEAKKAAFSTAEDVAGKKTEIAKHEEKLGKLRTALRQKEQALADAKKAPSAAPKPLASAASPTPAKRDEVVPLKPTAATLPPQDATASGNDARSAFEKKMKELGSVLGGKATPSVKVGANPVPTVELAKATTPKPGEATSPENSGKKQGSGATEGGFTNSLGMKMVPLPGTETLICVWPTRVRDFEAFSKNGSLKSSQWKDPGFKQGPDHPVVNVSWQDAMAFCKWLTGKEQKEGLISSKQSYRLPTDLEWSHAAGLNNENGATPESRDLGVAVVYPWGTGWPPPTGAGNYTGEETGSDVAIKGYNDGFPWTSPVGSFPPNKLGLYDMGGNVWQWCMDAWNADSKAKVLRGASWYNGALKLSLLTSCRVHASPDSSTDNYGFRIVLSGDSSHTTKR